METPHILLAEDTPFWAPVIKVILEPAGRFATTAKNRQLALNAVAAPMAGAADAALQSPRPRSAMATHQRSSR